MRSTKFCHERLPASGISETSSRGEPVTEGSSPMTLVSTPTPSLRSGNDPSSQWRVSPRADDHTRFSWKGGDFETASRQHTPEVEGSIRSDCHLIMVTL